MKNQPSQSWPQAAAFAWAILWRTAIVAFLPTALVAVLTQSSDPGTQILSFLLRLAVALLALAVAAGWLERRGQYRIQKVAAGHLGETASATPLQPEAAPGDETETAADGSTKSSRFFSPIPITWLSLFVVYGAFWLWYGGAGDPLAPEEVARVVELADQNYPDDPGVSDRVRRFAETDDGNEFFVVNLVKNRDSSEPSIDRKAGLRQLFNLVSRAGHPVAGGNAIVNLMEYEGATRWNQIMVVRYRSRRDLLEVMATSAFAEHARKNAPQFEKVVKLAATPSAGFYAGPRTIVAVLLAIVGLLTQAILRRKKTGDVPHVS